ncbi:hypothetical protein [Longimicrobium sp.]|jgi:hypothetical protein|uniref:hypothetical protein n=1 Tax=Longimicrobium sp. TaxID=2029185 RepID=UPI002F946D6C
MSAPVVLSTSANLAGAIVRAELREVKVSEGGGTALCLVTYVERGRSRRPEGIQINGVEFVEAAVVQVLSGDVARMAAAVKERGL